MAKGKCKHGEFDLLTGCAQCIADREADEGNTEGSVAKAVEGAQQAAEVVAEIVEEQVLLQVNQRALVRVSPENDEKVAALYNEGVRMLEIADARAIEKPEDLPLATNDLVLIVKTKKAIEEIRKEYVTPIRKHLDDVNTAFKDFTAPLIRAEALTRNKMNEYRAEVARRILEEEEINRKRTEAAQQEMKLKGELTESVDLVEVEPEVAKRVSTDLGSVGQRDHWKYEVFDFILVPDAYKVIDSSQLSAITKKHHDQKPIPGIRFYNEPIDTVNLGRE